jgi:spermidine/putrescine transport system permease protein
MFRLLRRGYAIFYLLLLYLPIALIPFFSFNDSVYVALPWRGFTLKWYKMLGGNDALQGAFWNSLTVAVSTAALATTIGTFAAMACVRYRFMGRRLIAGSLVAPLALPSVLIGVALLSFCSLSGIPLTLGTVAVGHLLICIPFSYGVLVSHFEGMNPDLELASGDLGQSPLWTLWRVTLPLASPALISSFLLSFTISFDEFILAFFLSSNSPTLPVFMWSQLRFPDRLPMVLALASVMLAFSTLLIVIALRLGQKPKARKHEAGI